MLNNLQEESGEKCIVKLKGQRPDRAHTDTRKSLRVYYVRLPFYKVTMIMNKAKKVDNHAPTFSAFISSWNSLSQCWVSFANILWSVTFEPN